MHVHNKSTAFHRADFHDVHKTLNSHYVQVSYVEFDLHRAMDVREYAYKLIYAS
jgi:hypothetical protein